MDGFYTSVSLAMLLLTLGYYSVGTVVTTRKGLAAQIVPDKKKKKKKEKKKKKKKKKKRCASKKYYKNRFLGSVDLAYINALIVFNHARTAANQAKLSHITFMTQLHLELYQISPRDWEELVSSPDPNFTPTKQRVAAAARHMPIQAEDKRKDNTAGSTKGRQRARQVCSVLKEKVTDGDTSFQCSNSEFKTIDQKTGETKASPLYLCNK
ncbi:hypothetical protein F441_22397, partial [Phytophthora nicotianae CJ01A1]